jgi:hypothetical protein
MSNLTEALKICGIKCKYCLDRKYLWRPRLNPMARMDFVNGGFDVTKCTKCNGGDWVRCSHSSENYEGGERLLKEDDSDELRYSMISGRANQILCNKKKMDEINAIKAENDRKEALAKLEREIKEKEQKEKERQRKMEEERKLIEEVDRQMNDGLDKPKYDNSIDNNFSSITENMNINIELGKMLDKVKNALATYSGDLFALVDLIKDVKFDLTISSEQESSSQTKCISTRTKNGYPAYLILKAKANKIKSSCSLLEWCGLIESTTKISLDYTVTFPKNNKAKEECEDIISEIAGSKIRRMKDIALSCSVKM